MKKDQKEQVEGDDMTRRLFRHAAMEEPSTDFTSQVMKKIEAPATATTFAYQPVITRSGWIFSILSAIALLFLLFYFFPVRPTGQEFMHQWQWQGYFVQDFTGNLIRNLSVFSALPELAAVLISGWLLLMLDKFRSRQNLPA